VHGKIVAIVRLVQSTAHQYLSKSKSKSRFFTRVKVKVLSGKVTCVKVKKVTMEKKVTDVIEVKSNFREKKLFHLGFLDVGTTSCQ